MNIKRVKLKKIKRNERKQRKFISVKVGNPMVTKTTQEQRVRKEVRCVSIPKSNQITTVGVTKCYHSWGN